ncbi:MAG: Ig-like domain-containing protein, partial [Acidimicrobiia bacterium]
KIAFLSTALEANPNILVMNDDGSGRTNLTTDGIGFDNVVSSPAWSPDGSRVAFQTPKDAGLINTMDSNIWTVTAAGASPEFVVGSTDDEVEPAWSPDGTLIAFRKSGTGGDKLYAIASDGSGSAARIGSASAPATNSAPDWRPVLKGVADTATVSEHGSVNIDVLANDSVLVDDAGTADTSATLAVLPTKGTASRQSDGTFTYTHTGAEIGTSSTTDTFTYTVTQGASSSTAVVTVTINPVDDDPTAVADSYAVGHGATLVVSTSDGVLGNDSDPEGLAITAQLGTDVTKGTLTLNANGSFTYTNDGLTSGATTDSFTYMAKDPGGNTSSPATVTLNVADENAAPPVVTVAGPEFGATGVKASFGSTVTDGAGAKTYAWSVKLGSSQVATGTAATLDFTPSATGAYTVSLTVTDDAGTDTDTVDFTVMTDINSSIFVNDIVWLANEGITKGCNPPTNDQYCPNDNVTRGQMAAFLVRFLGLTDDGGGNLFTDDNGSVFEHNIDILATAGITKGCNPPANDQYCPNDNVTRGQMAAFLVRALGLTDDGGGNLFTDDNGLVFEHNIDILATAGITKGCNAAGDQFCPNDFVTRGQMAAFLHRADGLFG